MKKFIGYATATAVSGLVGLSAGSASAVTMITVTGTNVMLTCENGADPVCEGFTDGGSPGFPDSAGTLSDDAADLYGVLPANETTVANALDILIDGDGGDDDFVGTDGERTEFEGDVQTMMVRSDAEFIAFKIGAGTFFVRLNDPAKLTFQAKGSQGGGLSNITSFGGATSVIPLPGSLSLFIGALGGLGFLSWRRRKAEPVQHRRT